MVGIVSGFEMFSNVKSVLRASSGFHWLMTRAWPGASISGMMVTPLLAQDCWIASKSDWVYDSLARLLRPSTAGSGELSRKAE